MYYLCNGKKFELLDQAIKYANEYFIQYGVILGIEGV